jgi:transcriptional regulator with XRE-family HTH domain
MADGGKISVAFGKVVKQERQKRGLSQEALAHEADIHRTHIGFIERGERSPSVDVAAKVAGALGVPLSKLIAQTERRLRRSFP